MIKTLLLILLFAISTLAQLPDLSTFKTVATTHDGQIGAFVDEKSIDRNADKVKFRGMLAPILGVKDGSPLIDPNNFIIDLVRADCDTKAYAFISESGRREGEFYERTFEPNTSVAGKDTVLEKVIIFACKNKDLREVKGKDGF